MKLENLIEDSIINNSPKSESNKSNSIEFEQIVTPWKVETDKEIDYENLIKKFGTEKISDELLMKFERVTGKKIHPWLKRGIFFSHRSLDTFLTAYEQKKPVFLYTGRGPTSESMHIGHTIPFMFTKYLQDTFDCPLVIQIADDEKTYFKKMDFNEVYKLGIENSKDIIAFGFNPKKTFIFSNRDYRVKQCQEYELFASDVIGNVSQKSIQKIFGLDESASMGMFMWPIYQSIAAFSKAFPHIFNGEPAHCLVAYAIDQDPYFRLARDIANDQRLEKPSSIMSCFLDPLTGPGKMSSSVGQDSTLFLTDNKQTIRKKIMQHAFSGSNGNGSLQDHKKYGGNIDTDISCKYLRYFEFDDEKYIKTLNMFKAGEISCSEIKSLLADKLEELVANHQLNRKKVTDDVLRDFYSMKPMDIPKQTIIKTECELKLYQFLDNHNMKHFTVYHNPITKVEHGISIIHNLNGAIPCKNLLLQGENMFFLYVAKFDEKVDLKKLAKEINVKSLHLAEVNQLKAILDIDPGFVTIFALLNDKQKRVYPILSEELNNISSLGFHPFRNDATTIISKDDLINFVYKAGFRFFSKSIRELDIKEFWERNAIEYSSQNLTTTDSDFVGDTIKNHIGKNDLENMACFGAADGLQDPLKFLERHMPNSLFVNDIALSMVNEAKKNLNHLNIPIEYSVCSIKDLNVSCNDYSTFISVYSIDSLFKVLNVYASQTKKLGTIFTIKSNNKSLTFNIENCAEFEGKIKSLIDSESEEPRISISTNTGFSTSYFYPEKFKIYLERIFKQEVKLFQQENNRNLIYLIEKNPKKIITIINNVIGNILPEDLVCSLEKICQVVNS